MAWPRDPLTSYVSGSLPPIKASDLNALQDGVNRAFRGTYSYAGIVVDGTGGNSVTPPPGGVALSARAVGRSQPTPPTPPGVLFADSCVTAFGAVGPDGTLLASEVRERMEGQLGADLSGVKVHTGGESAQAAEQLGARAFTTGSDVHFGSGEYAPGTKDGDRLLGHELTHVVQGQRSGIARKAEESVGPAGGEHIAHAEVSQPADAAEQEADTTGDKIAEELHGNKESGAAEAANHGGEDKGEPHEAGVERPREEAAPAVSAKLNPGTTSLSRKTPAPAMHGQPPGSPAAPTSKQTAAPLPDKGTNPNPQKQKLTGLPPRIEMDAEFKQAAEAVEGAKEQQKQGAGSKSKGLTAEAVKDGDPKDGGGKDGDKKPKPEEMTGIGATVAVERFVAAAKKIQGDWGKLKPQERANGMAKASNDELAAASVPAVDPRLEDIPEAGRLNFREWALRLGKPPFSKATVNDTEAAQIADTTYHESRHAEQWHRMARLQAGKGKKVEAIAKEMEIPPRIAADAAAKPLDGAKKEGAEAQGFYDSVYGKNAAHRNKVLTDLGTKGEARQKAQSEFEKIAADPKGTPEKTQAAKDAWVKAYNEWKKVYDEYKALPEEADAWKVGDAVTSKYLGKRAQPWISDSAGLWSAVGQSYR